MFENLGERIKSYRKENNLGLHETANKVGISSIILAEVERGDLSNIDEETLDKLTALSGESVPRKLD